MQHCHTAHVSAGDNDNNLAFRACGEDPKQDSSNDQPPPQETGRIVACGYFSITDPARSQLHCWSNVKMIAQAAGLCNQVWSPCLEVSGRDCELCHQVRQMQWSGMGLGGRMLHSSFHAPGGCICGFELLSQPRAVSLRDLLSHGGAPISWTSGRQPFIASSTADRS